MHIRILMTMLPLLLFPAATADAHAFLDHADPRVGSTVHAAPHTLTLWFTQDLEPAFCTLEVRDASGARVESGKASVGAGGRNVMRITLKPLSPGTYTVSWRVLSVDTHTSEGTFNFHVGE
jgi:methionine-rich copper-binding protein CopC